MVVLLYRLRGFEMFEVFRGDSPAPVQVGGVEPFLFDG
jgi:hypothetical protein